MFAVASLLYEILVKTLNRYLAVVFGMVIVHRVSFVSFLLLSFFQKGHPSALSSFQEMMDAAKGKCVVVFLDYDGTLSPIVNDPERAFMSDLVTYIHVVALL